MGFSPDPTTFSPIWGLFSPDHEARESDRSALNGGIWGNRPLPLTAGSQAVRNRAGGPDGGPQTNAIKGSQRESAATTACGATKAAFDADRPSMG